MSAGSTPAMSMAARPDSMPMVEVGRPMRRSRIPVRSRIHSSLVSIIAARSSLVRTFSGSDVPMPMTVAPIKTPVRNS